MLDRRDIQNVLYVEFGIAVVIFLAIFAYFPRHPPLPPSLSASVERMDFKVSIHSSATVLSRNKLCTETHESLIAKLPFLGRFEKCQQKSPV